MNKPIIISERITYLEKEIKRVENFINIAEFQPEERVFDHLKKLERELFELSGMQDRGQKYIWRVQE